MYKYPLYSKVPKYTGFMPFYDKAKGMDIWVDGKKYIDMCHHLGNTMLGASNSYINRHVKKCINKGNTSLLNHRYMEKLINLMLGMHQWADTVRFCNSGGEAMYLALRLAKEYKSKHKSTAVIWQFGYNGWIIKNNGENVNREFVRVVNFNRLNCILEDTYLKENRPDIVSFELIRHEYPKPEVIELLKKWQKQGTILVLDEITSGFKFNCGGSHLLYDLEPDICVFSKAIGNGYSISVIIGKEKYMESDLFISSTNWSDGIGFVAGYHTIKALKHCNYKLLIKMGKSVMKVWETCAKIYKVPITIGEVANIANFTFSKRHIECKSIFIYEMQKQGVLASDQFYPSFAHNALHLGKFARACGKAFKEVGNYLNNPDKYDIINKLEVIDK